ncbi:MAG: hypothetical protein V2B19_10475 [Pseudomonadota bacterium]
MAEIDNKKLDSLIERWNEEFDQLEAMLRDIGADPAADYDDVITSLRRHRNTAQPEVIRNGD